MIDIWARLRIAAVVSGAALAVAACGGGDKAAETGNAATTEMISTETTLDGTTNDATSLDAAAGANDEVATAANATATENNAAE